MNWVKGFLVLNAVMWLPYGLACLANPAMLTEFAGVAMTSATAMTEIRAMYGGVQAAVGTLCLAAVFNNALVRPALAVLAFLLTGLVIARGIGLVVDASGSEYTYGAVVFEAVMAAVSVLLYRRQAPAASAT